MTANSFNLFLECVRAERQLYCQIIFLRTNRIRLSAAKMSAELNRLQAELVYQHRAAEKALSALKTNGSPVPTLRSSLSSNAPDHSPG